jgi:hypothetical protein
MLFCVTPGNRDISCGHVDRHTYVPVGVTQNVLPVVLLSHMHGHVGVTRDM